MHTHKRRFNCTFVQVHLHNVLSQKTWIMLDFSHWILWFWWDTTTFMKLFMVYGLCIWVICINDGAIKGIENCFYFRPSRFCRISSQKRFSYWRYLHVLFCLKKHPEFFWNFSYSFNDFNGTRLLLWKLKRDSFTVYGLWVICILKNEKWKINWHILAYCQDFLKVWYQSVDALIFMDMAYVFWKCINWGLPLPICLALLLSFCQI